MAPYERGTTHSIELFNCRSAKRKGSKYPKGKFRALPRKVMFQKKLIVICYMGEKAPKQFTLKDSVIALRGVLPEIDVEARELDIRRVIADMIISGGEEFLSCSRYSFEFIEANGKSLYVPAKPTGFEWSGKAVKNLAGNGQVYVRLLYDPFSNSDSEDFPVVNCRQPPLIGDDEEPSCSMSKATLPPIGSRANNTQPPSRPEADTPPTAVYDETGVMQLVQMFPTTSESVTRYIYDLSRGDLACAADCILSGPCFETLIALISSVVLTGDGEGRKLKIDDNEQEGDDLAECVLAFYKGPRYDPHCGIRVSLCGQPAIDTGGVRRQVYSQVFERVAFSDRLCLFDGPLDRRRPAFRISSLSAGVMRLVGRMIGHSILLDRLGFPYLSPVCYNVMVGRQDQALLLCTPEDASERVQQVLKKVSYK